MVLDAFQAFSLLSASLYSLRIKVYRDLGFTPIEENGIFSKVLVRASCCSSDLLRVPRLIPRPLRIKQYLSCCDDSAGLEE